MTSNDGLAIGLAIALYILILATYTILIGLLSVWIVSWFGVQLALWQGCLIGLAIGFLSGGRR